MCVARDWRHQSSGDNIPCHFTASLRLFTWWRCLIIQGKGSHQNKEYYNPHRQPELLRFVDCFPSNKMCRCFVRLTRNIVKVAMLCICAHNPYNVARLPAWPRSYYKHCIMAASKLSFVVVNSLTRLSPHTVTLWTLFWIQFISLFSV